MAWDIEIKRKVYQRLADELFFRIYNGIYPLGGKLPALPQIAVDAGSSPETVRKAVRELQGHGVIEKTFYGYFVTSSQERIMKYRNDYLSVVEREYLLAKEKVNAL